MSRQIHYSKTEDEALLWLATMEIEAQAAGCMQVGYDVETSGLNPLSDALLFVQIHSPKYPPIILDVRTMGYEAAGRVLRPLLESEDWLKIGHNLQFDYAFTRHHLGVGMNRIYDTMLAEEIITAGLNMETNLKATAQRHLGRVLDKELRNDFLTLQDGEVSEELLEYMAEDVEVLHDIMRLQSKELKRHKLVDVARLEFALVPVLADITLHGVCVDKQAWGVHIQELNNEAERIGRDLEKVLQPYVEAYRNKKHSGLLEGYATALADFSTESALREDEARMYKQTLVDAGVPKGQAHRMYNEWKRAHPLINKRPAEPHVGVGVINLKSPEQVKGAFEEMGVKLPTERNGTSKTDRKSLNWIKAEYPIVELLLEYRGVQKLVDAFGEAVTDFIDEKGRLHPQYRQLVSTGRMSCSKPNIQQVPNNKIGAGLRQCFVAPAGHKILSADYSQIELRILLELAGETDAIEAVNAGLDLHSMTAARMYGLDYEHVKNNYETNQALKLKRRAAKAINFGIAYGLSARGLSQNEQIALKDAKKFIEAYFEANPNVAAWLERVRQEGARDFFVSSMLGRKRFFAPPSQEMMAWERDTEMREYLRQMTNHPIQGTSADITKIALVAIHKALQRGGCGAHIIMAVHDEIVLECPDEEVEGVQVMVVEQMKRAARLFLKKIEVEVGCSVGDNWNH